MKTPPALLRLRGISKFYRQGERRVVGVENINLSVKDGEFLAIIGASGSGKSTLLNLLGLLDRPSRGQIYLDGWRVRYDNERRLAGYRNRKLGFIFQQFNLLPRTTAWENTLLPAWYNPSLSRSQSEKRAGQLFRRFGLNRRREHFPNQLSGGEQQRVAIIRALLCGPKIILADEPTGNLDSRSGKDVIDRLIELNGKMGKTIILVTHNLSLARLARRQIWLKDGRIIKEK